MQNSRIRPLIWQDLVGSSLAHAPTLSTEFCEIRLSNFCVILLRGKQTAEQQKKTGWWRSSSDLSQLFTGGEQQSESY